MIKRLLAGVALMGAAAAWAGPDDAVLRGYVLTMAKVNAWHAATLSVQGSADPAVKRESAGLDNLLGGSIADGIAKVKAAPHVEALIRQKGLSDADYVLIPATLVGASMAVAMPQVAAKMPVSPGNLAFVRTHQAELKALQQ